MTPTRPGAEASSAPSVLEEVLVEMVRKNATAFTLIEGAAPMARVDHHNTSIDVLPEQMDGRGILDVVAEAFGDDVVDGKSGDIFVAFEEVDVSDELDRIATDGGPDRFGVLTARATTDLVGPRPRFQVMCSCSEGATAIVGRRVS